MSTEIIDLALEPKNEFLDADMPSEILKDESDFLNSINRENYATATVDAIIHIEESLDAHALNLSPKNENEIRELKSKRSFHLYNLLLLRNYDSENGISVKLVQGSGEEFHPFSQNRIVIKTEDPETNDPINFVTNLDILARTLPPSTSADILSLIDKPDDTEVQFMDRYIERVFEEAHAAQKAYCGAKKTGDDKTALAAAKTINNLLPDRLRLLRKAERIHVGFDEEKSLFYFYRDGESRRITEIPYFKRTDNLIEKSGGVTMTKPA